MIVSQNNKDSLTNKTPHKLSKQDKSINKRQEVTKELDALGRPDLIYPIYDEIAAEIADPESDTDPVNNRIILDQIEGRLENTTDMHPETTAPNIAGTPTMHVDGFTDDELDPAAEVRDFLENGVVPAMQTLLGNIGFVRIHIHDAEKANLEKVKKSSRLEKQEYLNTIKIRSDSQNVHETHVNHDFKRIFRKIKQKNTTEYSPADWGRLDEEMKKYFTMKGGKAQRYYLKMMEGNKIGQLDSDTREVLRHVWARTQSKDNIKNRKTLLENLTLNAESAFEGGIGDGDIVCITGRCYRSLGTFALADDNPIISKPVQTSEMLRSQIFARANKVIHGELAKADKKVKNDYATDNRTPEVEKLESDIKAKIERVITDEFSFQLSTTKLSKFIEEAQAGG